MQEAKEAAQNAIPLSEGVDQDDLRVFYDLLAVIAPYASSPSLRTHHHAQPAARRLDHLSAQLRVRGPAPYSPRRTRRRSRRW